ncbi:hypothetical protein ACW5R3_01225 [Bizionia sp. KMM 8389]
METDRNIKLKTEATINVADRIESVQASPFFKDRAMQRLFAEKEVKQTAWGWFTPKLQLATLVCLVVLNIFAFSSINKSTYNENVSEFAETYGLSTSTQTSILN